MTTVLPVPMYGEVYVERAFAHHSDKAIDVHQMQTSGNVPEGMEALTASDISTGLMDVRQWLPFAAEEYQVSANLNDYLLVPVTIFFSDIPNSNLAAFPFSELSKWNSTAGKVAYQTWVGKCTFEEHANQDTSQARGVIFGSAMRKVHNYEGDLYRVVLLSGWDRNRFPLLAASIEQQPTGFSMGAWVSDYHCGVCEASMRKGGCQHIDGHGTPRMQAVGNRLVYRKAINITGFELSKVGNPAWRSAVGRPIG